MAENFGPCSLHVPHKKWAYGEIGLGDAHQEEDNYAYLEQWSLRFYDCFPHGAPAPGPDPLLINGATNPTYSIPPSEATPSMSPTPLHILSATLSRVNPHFPPASNGDMLGFDLPGSSTVDTCQGHAHFVEQGLTVDQQAEAMDRSLVWEFRAQSDGSLIDSHSITGHGTRGSCQVDLANTSFFLSVPTVFRLYPVLNSCIGTGIINDYSGPTIYLSGHTTG